MVRGHDKTKWRENNCVPRNAVVFAQCRNEGDDGDGVHGDALVPAQFAGRVPHAFAEVQTAHHGGAGDGAHGPHAVFLHRGDPCGGPCCLRKKRRKGDETAEKSHQRQKGTK